MKKLIQINGKRNVDGIKNLNTKDKVERKIVKDIKDEKIKNTLDNKNQIEILNKLFLNESYPGIKFMKKEVERKILSYKNQDIKKNKYNQTNFISYDDCLEKLVISKLKCYYCKGNCLIFYKNKLEKNQWTLDRIDNSIGHERDNVVICCYKCNVKRGRLNDEKFRFTKQMKIIKNY